MTNQLDKSAYSSHYSLTTASIHSSQPGAQLAKKSFFDVTIDTKTTDSKHKPLPVYLFYPHINKRNLRGDCTDFFAKELNQLAQKSQGQPVFLSIDNAFQYGRFMDSRHVILKVFVPETAIVGQSQSLLLKKGCITKSHVHGCYPGWGSGQVYFKNPFYKENSVAY